MKEFRATTDAIDTKLADLLNKRARLVPDAGRTKVEEKRELYI